MTEFAPLYKGKNDEITTQWAMKEIERIGLLKMDFLGLSTLTLLERRRRGDQARRRATMLDLDTIPLDDAEDVPDVRRTAQTYGVFQFESSGMRDILRKAKPQRLDDLIALNALYRPGPAAQRHGRRLHRAQARRKSRSSYELPELEPILADTYGVIAYQEQVMRIAHVAGRLHARRGRHAAQGDGQEERRGHGEAARASSSTARRRNGHQREEGRRRSST